MVCTCVKLARWVGCRTKKQVKGKNTTVFWVTGFYKVQWWFSWQYQHMRNNNNDVMAAVWVLNIEWLLWKNPDLHCNANHNFSSIYFVYRLFCMQVFFNKGHFNQECLQFLQSSQKWEKWSFTMQNKLSFWMSCSPCKQNRKERMPLLALWSKMTGGHFES